MFPIKKGVVCEFEIGSKEITEIRANQPRF